MTPRDLALTSHLAEHAMGYTPNPQRRGCFTKMIGKGMGITVATPGADSFGISVVWFDPLTDAVDTEKLIEKIDKPMAINREDIGHGLWYVCFFNEASNYKRVEAEDHGDTFMRATCEAAGKLTGFEFEDVQAPR